MTKTCVKAGPCRFETLLTAEKQSRRQVKLTVETQCPNIQKLVAAMPEEFDAFKLCMTRPGQDALHQLAATILPPHAACPVLCGMLRTMEAEAGLCVKENMSVTFLDE